MKPTNRAILNIFRWFCCEWCFTILVSANRKLSFTNWKSKEHNKLAWKYHHTLLHFITHLCHILLIVKYSTSDSIIWAGCSLILMSFISWKENTRTTTITLALIILQWLHFLEHQCIDNLDKMKIPQRYKLFYMREKFFTVHNVLQVYAFENETTLCRNHS
jgi:hypothetical protein